MSTDQEVVHSQELGEGVTASVSGRILTVKGPLGTVKKNFDRINVNLEVKDGKVLLTPYTDKKKDVVSSNTASSLVRNIIFGVTKGYTYKLKIVFAHFPVTVKVKGRNVNVENFVGERSARVTDILGDCKVSVEGDDIIIKGVSLEDVGQTAANLEQATKIKRKDQRIFLDGIYVYEKIKGW
ncbi:MAG: 50S ribosomal protein L6 [Thaumarchaeota archaeon]|nr:50S ribosomal protein L6 [Nitrososphaerota archaeon]